MGYRQVLRACGAAVRRIPRRQLLWTGVAILIVAATLLFLPLPTALQMRDWARQLGPWFPLAFLGAHTIVTVLPFPRTAFTLAAGLLFGTQLGVLLAVVASTASAVLALWGVRALGWKLSALHHRPAVKNVDDQLRLRGWIAVMSMRLIPAVPFSVLNYAAGASAVRVVPYTLASFIGLLPGTLAVVVLGDALTGHISPTLFAVSLATSMIGVLGILYEIRRYKRTHIEIPGAETSDEPERVGG
ncbi:TVP38/TMEM64 family protein [Mycobacteroides sp. LB1]|uniref:TVP38/TMEM64 family protein n=1 Tax=Mycobacteroides sp. LB1 TaxID=2750814 RepID=UPI0015DE850D|nr:TVP38/TMEM64 family protein [Mycobacteroides sp. LB1]